MLYFQGDKGDKGNTGAKGLKGHTGHKGDQVGLIKFFIDITDYDDNLWKHVLIFYVLFRDL